MIPFALTTRRNFVCCLTLIAIVFLFPLLTAAAPPGQEIPCYELPQPECETPPLPSNQPPADNSPASAPWEGYSDERLNPEMAEYYSIWCLDNMVRVLRGVPTTALVDDIPIVDVSNLADDGLLTRDSGLTVARNMDTITISGSNGNLSSPGSKAFSLAECLERNGSLSIEQTVVTTDHVLEQAEVVNEGDSSPESTPEATAEAGQEESENSGNRWPVLPGNNDDDNLIWWIIRFIEDICGVPLGALTLMIPAGWTAWSRRKNRKPVGSG